LLARRLLPDRPVVWLLAPAIVVAVNSLYGGSISNDAMAMTMATAAAVLMLRSLDRFGQWWPAAAAGAVLGLGVLTKATVVVAVPFLAIAVVAALVVSRPGWKRLLVWAGAYAGAAIVVVAPWYAWNVATYGELTGSAAVAESLGHPLVAAGGVGLGTIGTDLTLVRPGIWLGQLLVDPAYQTLWEVTAVAAVVLAVGIAAARRRWRDVAVVAWCASALPIAFVTMELVFAGLFPGNGSPAGRHLLMALPTTAIVIAAAAAFAVGARWAPVLVAWLVAASLWLQVGAVDRVVDGTYLASAIDHRLSPTLVQNRADALVFGPTGVTIDAGCPVEAVSIGWAGVVPTTVTVTTGDERFTATGGGRVAWIPTYRLERAVDGPLTVEVPEGTAVAVTAGESVDGIELIAATGDPVAVAYCA
jgi:4-amino-4-deoxy-L-arabinose transferase-like glycosyltransferase